MLSPTLGGEAFMDALVDPFYPETITVYEVSDAGSDAYGTPTKTYTARTGLAGVHAAAAAVQNGKVIQREQERRDDLTRTSTWYRLQTPGSHHEITQSDEVGWRGEYWSVNAVVVDPSGTYTEMLVEHVSPETA